MSGLAPPLGGNTSARCAPQGQAQLVTMDRAPLVSVVIPTYNRERLVQEAIASVLAQGYPALEILVVDDGSTDNTVSRVVTLGPPIRVIPIRHSGRPGLVRNVGIREARGELIAFLDSDDLWLPGKLERQLDYLAAHPDMAVVYTNEYVEDRGQRMMWTRFDNDAPRSRVFFHGGGASPCVQASSVLLRREVLEMVGLFNEGLSRYEGVELWGRVSEQYALGFIEEPLVVYRLGVDSLHLTLDDWRRVREGRRYLAVYEARRGGKPRSAEKLAGVRQFERKLRDLEAQLRAAGEGAHG